MLSLCTKRVLRAGQKRNKKRLERATIKRSSRFKGQEDQLKKRPLQDSNLRPTA